MGLEKGVEAPVQNDDILDTEMAIELALKDDIDEITELPKGDRRLLSERFAGIKSRAALTLLSVGISMADIPKAEAFKPVEGASAEQIINQLFSPKLIEDIEKNGFRIKMTLKLPENSNKPGVYIVHFGQIHQSPIKGQSRTSTNDLVRDYQDMMYNVYPGLVGGSDRIVLIEGYTDLKLKDKEYVKQINNKLKQVFKVLRVLENAPIKDVEYANKVAGALVKINMLVQKIRHPDTPKLIEIFDKIQHKIEDFAKNNKETGAGQEIELLNSILELLKLNRQYTNVGGIDGYSYEATLRLLHEGILDEWPGEESGVNEKGIDTIKEAQVAEETIRRVHRDAQIAFRKTEDGKLLASLINLEYIKTLSKEERSKAFKKMRDLSKKRSEFLKKYLETSKDCVLARKVLEHSERLIHYDREMAVYRQIIKLTEAHPERTKNMRYVTVEYGAAHTFADSAKEWNMKPDVKVQFGIIEIKDVGKKKDDK